MAVLNYATNYEKALKQRFTTGLRFSKLYNTSNNATVKWTGANTVRFPRITTTGMVDYNRDTITNATRKVDNDWETKVLEHDRQWKTLIDPMDIDETNLAVSIANFTRVYNDEEKTPEMDKYMASKLYSEFIGYGGLPVTTPLDVTNILSTFDDMMTEMDEAEVPEEGRLLYVTPTTKKLLKQAEDIQRQILVTNNNGKIDRAVRSLDEVEIIAVPSSRMKSAYDFTEGAVPAVGAKQMNMILIHPNTVIAPQKYEFASLAQPSAVTDLKYLWNERKYWDVFLFERRVPGVQMHVDA
ncbi:capsid protein [Bacillus thuringiensis]|uniref:Capsid protein n=1 Tax=Bacillus thuringiensis TaxID=1428 RepID=A0A9X7GK25_BACTU|nr:capsid protein [Bacillus thuringiensis]PGH85774.1 capsid protein [Bacillus thuringiensis]